MNESFERIEPLLYKRQYETSNGEWSTRFYAIFVDWKRKRRNFPLGSDLKTARKKLKKLLGQNEMEEDFDKNKSQTEEMTLSKWASRYFELKRRKKSLERDKCSYMHLAKFFGDVPLSGISTGKIIEYRNVRLEDPIFSHGKVVEGKNIKDSTVNRELACLRGMLNLAKKEGKIKELPSFEMESEKKFARKRVISEEEYQELLKQSRRYLQRVLIALYETAMRISEVLELTWDRVDERVGVISLLPEDDKEDDKRTIPISPTLQEVLDELRMEQKKVGNIVNRVFTRQGRAIKNINTAFEGAKKRAKIQDVVIHDFRHTAITRWAVLGVPQEAALLASGHKSLAMHYRYANLQPHHVREVFTRCLHEKRVDESKALRFRRADPLSHPRRLADRPVDTRGSRSVVFPILRR